MDSVEEIERDLQEALTGDLSLVSAFLSHRPVTIWNRRPKFESRYDTQAILA